ncbi:P-loop containing nucleoside triphosphate hydrolase protein [Daedaleopsis nitida]|nr:P-loop containing nucleoside triphosphate hydrolase protein [Daedaleopsis nitida]
MPRKGGPPQKISLPHVKKVLAVASGKGGVGKSTVAVNLAFSLSLNAENAPHPRPRVGLLDLDIFGPSVPKLMALETAEEPELTEAGAIRPLIGHGLPCMSMGFLLPQAPGTNSSADTAVVWRGLMVQKAVQQLLFDVDWRDSAGTGLDVLVIDMPPGTGDVPLTLGQLVNVDGAVIVSTPQDVALTDVRKGISMFQKVSVPIAGLMLNQSHFICPSCSSPHELFGSPASFRATAARFGVDMLGELPLVPAVSTASDRGVPYVLSGRGSEGTGHNGGKQWMDTMAVAASQVWQFLSK